MKAFLLTLFILAAWLRPNNAWTASLAPARARKEGIRVRTVSSTPGKGGEGGESEGEVGRVCVECFI